MFKADHVDGHFPAVFVLQKVKSVIRVSFLWGLLTGTRCFIAASALLRGFIKTGNIFRANNN